MDFFEKLLKSRLTKSTQLCGNRDPSPCSDVSLKLVHHDEVLHQYIQSALVPQYEQQPCRPYFGSMHALGTYWQNASEAKADFSHIFMSGP